jgi:hypothetical protein
MFRFFPVQVHLMPLSLAELLHDWHDFYVVAGTASATLVGLMFVAASLGSSIFNEQHLEPLKAFLTPTVVHFASVVFACLLVIIPTHTPQTLGGLLAAGGVLGVGYCVKIFAQLVIRRRFKVDFTDRLFYALIPLLGYLLLLIAGVLLWLRSKESVNVLAAGMLTLLLAGIRNAWDMTLWTAIKTPSVKGPSS